MQVRSPAQLERDNRDLTKQLEQALQLFKAERERNNEYTAIIQKLGRIGVGLLYNYLGVVNAPIPNDKPKPTGIVLHNSIYKEDGRYLEIIDNDPKAPETVFVRLVAPALQSGKPS